MLVSEVVVAPDAEAVLVAHLRDVLTDADVRTKVPNPRPAGALVKVTQVGGQRWSLVAFSAMLTFECWAPDDVTASDLCRLVYAQVWAMPGQDFNDVWIYRCVDVAGVAAFPDPDTGNPRYQCTVQLDMRGKAV